VIVHARYAPAAEERAAKPQVNSLTLTVWQTAAAHGQPWPAAPRLCPSLIKEASRHCRGLRVGAEDDEPEELVEAGSAVGLLHTRHSWLGV
jgi:hypothetical protein